MSRSYWSLRNKTEDVERALAEGNNVSARMAAYELGVRLSHTITATQEHADSRNPRGQADPPTQAIDRKLTQFGAELDRLMAFIKTQQTPRAAEALKMMFELLNDLDRDASDKNVE